MYRGVSGSESPILLRKREYEKFLEEVCCLKVKPYAVCVRVEDVKFAKEYLEKHKCSAVRVVAAVGFPDGTAYDMSYKVFEAQYALNHGADEVDFVMNYEALQCGDHGAVLYELQSVIEAIHRYEAVAKVIIEVSELTTQLISQACHLAMHASADFVKTSTGFSLYGARADHLAVIRSTFNKGIKISGGVTIQNMARLLTVAAADESGRIELDPKKIRIGESVLLEQVEKLQGLSAE